MPIDMATEIARLKLRIGNCEARLDFDDHDPRRLVNREAPQEIGGGPIGVPQLVQTPHGTTAIVDPAFVTGMSVADPWRHRSAKMRCSTCMWYVEKPPEGDKGAKTIGRCRRHAPTMNGYPVVFPDDWCGDHKLDETKA